VSDVIDEIDMSDLDFEQTVALPPPRQQKRLLPRLVIWTSSLYLICLTTLAIVLWKYADRWWPATVLLYSPRWLMTLPMFLLAPLAIAVHRKSLITLALATIVLAWPLLGLRLSVLGLSSGNGKPALRVLSCNIHRSQLNTNDFRAIIDQIRPDVIALQDWSSNHQEGLFGDDDWHFRRDGELFIASRYPIIEAHWIALNEPPLPKFAIRLGAAMHYRLQTPSGTISVINLHLSSPHVALQSLWKWGDGLAQQLDFNSLCRDQECTSIEDVASRIHEPLIILGDFNTPPESNIYREHWSGFINAFNARGFGFGTTHSSTASSVRIDHILLNDGLTPRRCWLEQPAGSPHKPLVAEVDLTNAASSLAGAGQ
jgi:vancomycin resistance protein VanJ